MLHPATTDHARRYFRERQLGRRRHNLLDCERTSAGIWVPTDFDDLTILFAAVAGHSLLDLGAGDGLALAAAAPFFTAVHGIEHDPTWAARAFAARRDLGLFNVTVVDGDYHAVGFRGYSVLFIAPMRRSRKRSRSSSRQN